MTESAQFRKELQGLLLAGFQGVKSNHLVAPPHFAALLSSAPEG